MIETIMEHITREVNMDPVEVRLNNMDNPIPNLIQNLKKKFTVLLTFSTRMALSVYFMEVLDVVRA